MNQKGFSQLILVIIVGVVVATAGGGFWYYQQSAKQSESATGTQATTEPSSAPVVPESSSSKTPPAPIEQEKQANQNAVPKTPAPTNIPTPTEQVPAPADATPPAPSTPNISCNSPADTRQMDIFDSHVHANPKVSMSQIISEMDKAGVSVANLYGGTLDTASQYLGRFIIFVDTPGDWLEQGQAFVATAEAQMKTEKYYVIGETNLRYYTGKLIPPPTVYIPADTPAWLRLVD
ncbi:MAG: hypothetical protein Q7S60_06060, partial [bacterium]|nr:hypothetical protein [bacterium]